MCMVSMMVDNARTQWPPVNQCPLQPAVDLTDIIRRLSEIDNKMGAKDCYDPKKDEFIQQLQDRIAELEKQVKPKRKKKSKKK